MWDINTILISIITPITVAVIATLITAYFSLRQFRRERMWELKVETYENIFDALFDFDEFWRNRFSEVLTGEELDYKYKKELTKAYDEAAYELGRVVFSGEFVIEKEAVVLLNELDRNLQIKEPNWIQDVFTSNTKVQFVKSQRKLITDTVTQLRTIAKRELKTSG